DAALEVIGDRPGALETIGRGADDRGGDGVVAVTGWLAAAHGQGVDAGRSGAEHGARRGRLVLAPLAFAARGERACVPRAGEGGAAVEGVGGERHGESSPRRPTTKTPSGLG